MRYHRCLWRGAAAVVCVALSACEQPEWRRLSFDESGPTLKVSSRDPLPRPPEWLSPLKGRPVAELYPREAECLGATDAVTMTYLGAPAGVRVVGWAWARRDKAAPPRIILTGEDGRVMGGGESGMERLDVPNVVAEATSNYTGWWALAQHTQGRLNAFGVLADGRTVCKLGSITP